MSERDVACGMSLGTAANVLTVLLGVMTTAVSWRGALRVC